ncbi:hypothetical protein STENM223S_09187 [Streptomyces tendae]
MVLWTAAGVATLGFLVALEIVARGYGFSGPITEQSREVIFTPESGPLLYGGLALTMVVLTWRQRLIALGIAAGVDVVFVLVRWALDADMNFGNGALWVVLGCAVLGLTRRTGRERLLLLKGTGLGLLLVAGHKTGDTWLLITSKTRATVLDPYVAAADHALADPSWLAGRLLDATAPVSTGVLHVVYGQLPLAAALVGLYQLRRVAVERRFPAHHLVRTFLVIGLFGPAIYMIFPVVGPVFAYGADGGAWATANIWPDTLPPVTDPQPIPFDGITPRNCMPSLHTAWAVTLFVHSRDGSRAMRWAGTFWLRQASSSTRARRSSSCGSQGLLRGRRSIQRIRVIPLPYAAFPRGEPGGRRGAGVLHVPGPGQVVIAPVTSSPSRASRGWRRGPRRPPGPGLGCRPWPRRGSTPSRRGRGPRRRCRGRRCRSARCRRPSGTSGARA